MRFVLGNEELSGFQTGIFAELIEIGKRDAFDITRWKILKKMLNLSGL